MLGDEESHAKDSGRERQGTYKDWSWGREDLEHLEEASREVDGVDNLTGKRRSLMDRKNEVDPGRSKREGG